MDEPNTDVVMIAHGMYCNFIDDQIRSHYYCCLGSLLNIFKTGHTLLKWNREIAAVELVMWTQLSGGILSEICSQNLSSYVFN